MDESVLEKQTKDSQGNVQPKVQRKVNERHTQKNPNICRLCGTCTRRSTHDSQEHDQEGSMGKRGSAPSCLPGPGRAMTMHLAWRLRVVERQ